MDPVFIGMVFELVIIYIGISRDHNPPLVKKYVSNGERSYLPRYWHNSSE